VVRWGAQPRFLGCGPGAGAAAEGRSARWRVVVLDHVSLPVEDLERAAAFYDAVLATLGLVRRKEQAGAIGYGPPTRG